MVDRTDDFDAPSFIDRRGFLRLGGFTVAATAVLAACGSDEGAGPEEITQAGSAPPEAEAPSGVITDSTLLRTATSLHYNAMDVIDTVLALGVVSAEMAIRRRVVQGAPAGAGRRAGRSDHGASAVSRSRRRTPSSTHG